MTDPDSQVVRTTTRKPRWRRWMLEIAIIIVILLGVQAWHARDVPGGMAPDFSAPGLEMNVITLADWRDTHAGQAIALYFWADWCPICSAQRGTIDTLQADYPILTLAMQSGDSGSVRRYLAEHGLDWATAVDEDGRIAARFGLHGVPAFITIAPDGQISSVAIGYTTGLGMRLRLLWAGLGRAGRRTRS